MVHKEKTKGKSTLQKVSMLDPNILKTCKLLYRDI